MGVCNSCNYISMIADLKGGMNHFQKHTHISSSTKTSCSVCKGAVKYSMSDSEDEFDDWGKKGAPTRKVVISDDDASFAPEPSAVADSDVDSPPPPPPRAPQPT